MSDNSQALNRGPEPETGGDVSWPFDTTSILLEGFTEEQKALYWSNHRRAEVAGAVVESLPYLLPYLRAALASPDHGEEAL